MYGSAISVTNGRLVSCCSCLLGALLPSGPSWPLLSALVPFCSSTWLLGPVFLWHGYTSKSWFCLVRRSTIAARVCTCLSRAVVCGSSPWWLLVTIERVSTIQLFVWEVVVWLLLRVFPKDGANYWCQKSSVSYTVLACSRQNLQNRNKKKNLAKSTGMVPAKYPLKVKLERISITLECQSWENYAYLDLWGF